MTTVDALVEREPPGAVSAESSSAERRFSPGALKIITTAEKLFAERGLEAVSTRMISREAGHKNHSALQYHFGNRDALIEAILDYRVTPINQRRLEQLRQLPDMRGEAQIEALVGVFVGPFADELLRPIDETAYVSILAQLYAYQRGREIFMKNRVRTRALHEITSQLIRVLKPVPLKVIHFRLQLMGRQTMAAVAEWDEARRNGLIELDAEALVWRKKNLVRFIVGGLTAAVDQ